jgi:hypothetical protein
MAKHNITEQYLGKIDKIEYDNDLPHILYSIYFFLNVPEELKTRRYIYDGAEHHGLLKGKTGDNIIMTQIIEFDILPQEFPDINDIPMTNMTIDLSFEIIKQPKQKPLTKFDIMELGDD